MNFVIVSALFKYFLHLKRGVGPSLFPTLKERWFVSGSVETFSCIFAILSLSCLEKGHGPSFEKFPSPTNAMCQIWLKLASGSGGDL